MSEAPEKKESGAAALTTLEKSLKQKIERALEAIAGIAATDVKVTDILRLLQLRKELSESGSRSITVHWVEECRNMPATEK
jgi:hypothetical protein